MICIHCGKNNKDSSRFCARCGMRLEMPAAGEEKPAVYTEAADFENEKTEIFRDREISENEETVILSDETVLPSFDFRGHVPVYKENSGPQADSEISYIRELRGLKGLLDDGIITQEEFELKKKYILGI